MWQMVVVIMVVGGGEGMWWRSFCYMTLVQLVEEFYMDACNGHTELIELFIGCSVWTVEELSMNGYRGWYIEFYRALYIGCH